MQISHVSSSASPFVFPCVRYFVSHSILIPALRLVTLQNVCSIYRRVFIMFGFPYLVTAARCQRSYVNTLTVNAAILPRPRNVDILGISSVSLCSVLAVMWDRFPVFYFKNIVIHSIFGPQYVKVVYIFTSTLRLFILRKCWSGDSSPTAKARTAEYGEGRIVLLCLSLCDFQFGLWFFKDVFSTTKAY